MTRRRGPGDQPDLVATSDKQLDRYSEVGVVADHHRALAVTLERLIKNPRVHTHHTSTSGSRWNMVEIFIGIITRQDIPSTTSAKPSRPPPTSPTGGPRRAET